jgi:histidine triad (HIT) family protein
MRRAELDFMGAVCEFFVYFLATQKVKRKNMYNNFMNCIFCGIADGSIKSQLIYEDDDVVAFKDLNPQAPTHLLIIPRKHIARLSEADEKDALLLGKILLVAKKLAKQFDLKDFRLVTNNGKGAGQSVDHLHFHLMAGRRFLWPAG